MGVGVRRSRKYSRTNAKRERIAPLPFRVLCNLAAGKRQTFRRAYWAFEKVAKFSLPTKPNFVTLESVMIFITRFVIS